MAWPSTMPTWIPLLLKMLPLTTGLLIAPRPREGCAHLAALAREIDLRISRSASSRPTSPGVREHGLRCIVTGSTPAPSRNHASRGDHFVASLVRFPYGLSSCSRPFAGSDRVSPANRGFYIQAFDNRSPSPSLDITTTVNWTPLFGGTFTRRNGS